MYSIRQIYLIYFVCAYYILLHKNTVRKMFFSMELYIRGRYRISRKGGRGLSRVWIFHTWTFCSGTYHGGGRDKMLSILWDREGKMPILTKHFIFDTDGQSN